MNRKNNNSNNTTQYNGYNGENTPNYNQELNNFDNQNYNGDYNQNYNGEYPQNYNENYNQNYNNEYNQNYNEQYDNSGYNENVNNQYNPNGNYHNYDNNVPPMNTSYKEYAKEEKKKSIIPVILTAIVTFAVLVVGLYFGYNKFIKKENVADLSTYEVNFVAYGAEGEGKPEVDIKKVPTVNNSTSEISNLLANPDISFDKQSSLKNGDKVEVTITLNKNTAQKLNLKTVGEFKRTFTVNGLNEKATDKETIIVREGSSNSSSNGSRRSDERTVYVKPSAGVNLRVSSNDSSRILTSIAVGKSVSQHYIEVNSDGEAWAYVSYNGQNGWIRADLIG